MFWKPAPNRLLLRAAFGPPERALIFWEEFKASTPIEHRHSSLSSICGHILTNLKRGGFGDSYLQTMSRLNFLRTSARLSEASEVISELNSKFGSIQLKGSAVLEAGANRSSRSIGDIDLYVYPKHLHQSIHFLTTLGFSPAHGVSLDELWDHIVPKRGSWSMVRDKVDLDIHWKIFDHLSLEENASLVRKSTTKEFGGDSRLELVLAHSLFHDLYQAHDIYQGLFDFISLRDKVHSNKIWEIGSSALLTNHFAELNEIVLSEISLELFKHTPVDAASPYKDLLNIQLPRDTIEKSPRFLNRVQVKSELNRTSSRVFKHPRIYKFWDLSLRSARLEKFLLSFCKSFTRVPPNVPSEYIEGPDTSKVECLGIGWCWRDPIWSARYSEGPDARFLLAPLKGSVSESKSQTVDLELHSQMWENATASSIDFFASGYFLGTILRGKNSYSFNLPRNLSKRDVIEFSLRPRVFLSTKKLGEGTHWYRYCLPIVSARVTRGPRN